MSYQNPYGQPNPHGQADRKWTWRDWLVKVFLPVLAICATIVAALISTGAFPPKPTPTTPTPVPTSPSVSQTTAAASPTSTVVIENRTIPCVVNNCTVVITLDTVTIDQSWQNMSWIFTLSSGPGCVANYFGMYLEDSNGTKYQAGGTAAEGFTIAPGRPIPLTALFAFPVKRGAPYQLHIVGLGSNEGFECITSPIGGGVYQDVSFSFK